MMHRKQFFACLLILGIYSGLFAVGESAVITLEFPMGAENTGMGESGVSLDNSIYCAFFNPASVASFGKKQNLQFCYGTFYEPLLPAFSLPDLYHTDTTFGFFLNSFIPYIDFGYVHYKNFINMGINIWTDSMGITLDTVFSWEVVDANVLGITIVDALSVGATIKKFDSQLLPGTSLHPAYTAQGTNYDFGIRLHPHFSIKELITVEPAIGIAWQTLGQKTTKYIDTGKSEPLPRKLLYGISTTADLLGLFSYTGVFEIDRQDFDYSSSWADTGFTPYETSRKARDRTYHEGHRFGISPFYYKYFGYLYDYHGSRLEKTRGSTRTFNYRNLINTIITVTNLFDKKIGPAIAGFEQKFVPGFLKLNFYVAKSKSTIYETEMGVRDGQTREDFAWGLTIAGSLESIKKAVADKKEPVKIIAPADTVQTKAPPVHGDTVIQKTPVRVEDFKDGDFDE